MPPRKKSIVPGRKRTTKPVRGERKGKTATPSNPTMPIVGIGGGETSPTGRAKRKDAGTSRELTQIAEKAEAYAERYKYVRPADVAQCFLRIAESLRKYDQRDRLEEDKQ